MASQSQRVLNALVKGGSVSPLDFDGSRPIVDGGPPIKRLAARVGELRARGVEIVTQQMDGMALYVLVDGRPVDQIAEPERDAPDDVPTVKITPTDDSGFTYIPDVLATAFGVSRSEGHRLQRAGAVKINGDVWHYPSFITNFDLDGAVVQVGKRRFAKVAMDGPVDPADEWEVVMFPDGQPGIVPRSAIYDDERAA